MNARPEATPGAVKPVVDVIPPVLSPTDSGKTTDKEAKARDRAEILQRDRLIAQRRDDARRMGADARYELTLISETEGEEKKRLEQVITTAKASEQAAIAELVMSNDWLVSWLALRYAKQGIEIDDLKQEAYEELLRTARTYNAERGTTFVEYSTLHVTGKLRKLIARTSRPITISRGDINKWPELRRVRRVLTDKLQREPTNTEIASEMGVKVEVVDKLVATYSFRTTSYDAPDKEGGVRRVETPDPSAPSQTTIVNSIEVRARLARLPERTRLMIIMRMQGVSQGEIGRHFGIQQAQVSRILKNAMTEFKDLLED